MTLIPETPCGNNTLGHRLAHLTRTHAISVCTAEIGKETVIGLVEGLRKGSGNMLTEMPKVGDKVRYVGERDYHFLTRKKVYEVTRVGSSGFWFEDNHGQELRDGVISRWESVSETQDAVNSPQHYKRGKYETIEVIEHITAGYDDGFVSYAVGNCIKYVSRAPYKHADSGLEDLKKARKYLDFAIERIEGDQ